jgi:hypothetical protein
MVCDTYERLESRELAERPSARRARAATSKRAPVCLCFAMTPIREPTPSLRRARRARAVRVAVALAALLCACATATASASAHAAPAAARAARTAHAKPKPKSKPKSKPKPVLSTYAVRALLGYEAMQQSFYIPGSGLYRGAGEPEYAFLWPFSQALAATVSLSRLPARRAALAPARRALLVGLRQYLSTPAAPSPPASGEQAPTGEETTAAGQSSGEHAVAATVSTLPSYDGNVAPPAGPGGASYYDDNEWVGIELVRLYELERNPAALQQAEQIMAFVMAGWQTVSPASGQPVPCPGGVPFSNARGNLARNTVTDGPGAELAVQLYRLTHNIRYLEFAEIAYGWVRACLLEPSGLYADHINLSGSIDRTLWSYNQGSMMGAAMLLYEATRNPEYLAQARTTEHAALAYYSYARLSGENPFFVAVYFRNLLYLQSLTHEGPGTLPVREYLYYAWLRHRLADNLFAYGSPPVVELLRQASIVQLYALLAIPPATYF